MEASSRKGLPAELSEPLPARMFCTTEQKRSPMKKYVLTVSCKSTRGIVAAISGFLAEHGCNIVDSAQFDDLETGTFFMRVSFLGRGSRSRRPGTGLCTGGRNVCHALERIRRTGADEGSADGIPLRTLPQRSPLPLEDRGAAHRHRRRGLKPFRLSELVVNHDIPFHQIAVTKENKPQAEAQLLEIVERSGAELIVLARQCRSSPIVSAQKCPAGSSTFTTPSCRHSRAQIPTSKPICAASS